MTVKRPERTGTRLTVLLFVLLIAGCAKPYVQPSTVETGSPKLTRTCARMEDGYCLPVTRWEAPGKPRAIVLSLHGLNDYSHAFENIGRYFSTRGITVIAYDQRGFGNTEGRGFWHGSDRLSADLVTMTALVNAQYDGVPLYLAGESMGGAVVLMALASNPLDIDGAVLIAPAVWSRDYMPFYQNAALWLAAHTMPSRLLTGDGLDITPSDNIEMLKALQADERVIKATRVDVLYGVTNLMDTAMQASRETAGNILMLYGKHDEIIPAEPTCLLLERLSGNGVSRLNAILYEQGYHMLTRDLNAVDVIDDIATWITEREQADLDNNLHAYCAGLNVK